MTSAGMPLPSWADTYADTGPFTLTGPESIPNEAEQRSYLTQFWLDGDTDALQGGNQIQDFVITGTGSTAQNTLPGAERSISQPQVLAKITGEWRLTEDYMAFNALLLGINSGGNGGTPGFQTYKRETVKEERRFATSINNKMDADLAAQPNVNTQEGTGALAVDPMSLWTGINEYGGDGSTIFDADTTAQYPFGNGLPNGFTTIGGRNPTTDKWYRCWQLFYNDSISTSTVNPGAIDWVKAMVQALNLISYKAMPYRPGESTTNNPIANPDYIIPVSIYGDAYVKKFLGAAQNYLRIDAQDPYYPNPRFAGIPIVPWAQMDTAAVFPTSGHTAPAVGAGVTEMNADKAGPRFPIVGKKWFRWFFHSQFKFHMWPTKYPAKQWDTEIRPMSCLHNRMLLSRRKLAMVAPHTDITGL